MVEHTNDSRYDSRELIDSRSAVRFSFGPHTSYDLSDLLEMKKEMHDFFSKDSVNVYFAESYASSRKVSDYFFQIVNSGEYSAFDGSLVGAAHLAGELINFNKISNLRTQVLNTPNLSWEAHEMLLIDDIRETYPVDVIFEGYPDSDTVRQKRDHYKTLILAKKRAYLGKDKEALNHFTNGLKAYAKFDNLRDSQIRDQLGNIVDIYNQQTKPLRLYVRLGAYHRGIANNLGLSGNIFINSSLPSGKMDYFSEQYFKARSSQNISQDDLQRGLFGFLLSQNEVQWASKFQVPSSQISQIFTTAVDMVGVKHIPEFIRSLPKGKLSPEMKLERLLTLVYNSERK